MSSRSVIPRLWSESAWFGSPLKLTAETGHCDDGFRPVGNDLETNSELPVSMTNK